MQMGDLVSAVKPFVLRSGCSMYDKAVVVSVEPLVLISQQGDMLWSQVEVSDVRKVGVAVKRALHNCIARLCRGNRDVPTSEEGTELVGYRKRFDPTKNNCEITQQRLRQKRRSMSKTRKLTERNSCHNCDFRRWGEDEGWDKCKKTGKGISWNLTSSQICDDHKVTNFSDPRIRSERVCPQCKTQQHNHGDTYCSSCGSKYVKP